MNLDIKLCLLANVSHCEASNSERFVVVVYNPLSSEITDYIRLPTNNNIFNITGPGKHFLIYIQYLTIDFTDGDTVIYQLTPVIKDFSYVAEIQPSSYDLVFKAEHIPPLGIKFYYIEGNKVGYNKLGKSSVEKMPKATDTIYVGTLVSDKVIEKFI